jgi:hypothetical protein
MLTCFLFHHTPVVTKSGELLVSPKWSKMGSMVRVVQVFPSMHYCERKSRASQNLKSTMMIIEFGPE